MEGTLYGDNYSCVEDQDDPEYSPEDIKDSPQAHNSTKRSKRASEKKVVCVPIKDVKGCRLKGETPPPSDLWAWRKYGQKPIKGSPYPRGYYRCSSSKGCPARKQVERSRTDPTMLVVTYSCEHNHSLPASSRYKYNNNSNNNNNNNDTDKALHEPVVTTAATEEVTSVSTNSTISSDDDMVVFGNQFINIAEEPLLSTYDFEFKWFSDLVSTSTTNESPIRGITDSDETMVFPLGEEDESLFADLGELPECSLVW